MRNAGLDEAQAGIKMARRNNNMQMIWLRGESVCLQGGRPGFNPWVGKIPWRRKWQPTPVFLPEESQGRRSLVGYSPWGHKESDTTERLYFHFHHPYGRKWRRTKEPLDEAEKVGLKLNIQKTKIMVSGSITSWQIDGETMETAVADTDHSSSPHPLLPPSVFIFHR